MQLHQSYMTRTLQDSGKLWNDLVRRTNPIKEFSEQPDEHGFRRARLGFAFSIALIGLAASVEFLFLALLLRAFLR